jgi:acetoacetate decarboxylase
VSALGALLPAPLSIDEIFFVIKPEFVIASFLSVRTFSSSVSALGALLPAPLSIDEIFVKRENIF